MRQPFGQRITPSLVISILALIVAVAGGGVAIAALSKKKVKKIAGAQVTKLAPTLDVRSANTADSAKSAQTASTADSAKTANTADSATHAEQADTATNATNAANATNATNAANATNATNAATADTAANALQLGGIPPSGYTRSDCLSHTGQLKGWAIVPATGLTTTYSNIPGYNCSGGFVQARRDSGFYQVRFVNSPVTVAVASSLAPSTAGSTPEAEVAGRVLSTGVFEFRVTADNSASVIDQQFAVLAP